MILHHVFSKKEINQIKSRVDYYFKISKEENAHAIRNVLGETPDSNWYVTWHQDIIINVKERIETEGFTGWTKKNGIHGVCPPEEFLKDTITIRIHLDDADETNGALKVVPGSHNKKLSDTEITLITQNSIPYICDVAACGVQIMRPLLLHSSSKATSQKHRRVIHLEFNTMDLPNGLEWAEKFEVASL
jgi:ectoine hydroxylase-related dioxygenase (phytanoyl-CoA dioxygenase family)